MSTGRNGHDHNDFGVLNRGGGGEREIVDAPGEVWRNVDAALRQGLRSFPGGGDLAKLIGFRHESHIFPGGAGVASKSPRNDASQRSSREGFPPMFLDYACGDITRVTFAKSILDARGIRCDVRLNCPVPETGATVHRLRLREQATA